MADKKTQWTRYVTSVLSRTSTPVRPRPPKDPVPYRLEAQDRCRSRRRDDHRLDGPGARARYHHRIGGRHLLLERPPDQHHRHARSHRLHRRSRALFAGARRRCVWYSTAKWASRAKSETVWRQADKYGVPRICFINKINQTGGDFYKSLDTIHARLSKRAFPIHLPIGFEQTINGVVDLVNMKAYTYKEFTDHELVEGEIPADMLGQGQEIPLAVG